MFSSIPRPSMGMLLILVWIGSTLADFIVPKNCAIQPFSLPFANQTILTEPDLSGAHRGVRVDFGSDGKRLSLTIATTTNMTFVSDSRSICNTSAPDGRQCAFWRGGLFEKENSATWKLDTRTIPYNGSAANPGYDALNKKSYGPVDPLADFPRGWDTIQLNTNNGIKPINGYPFSLVTNASFPFGAGMLGLASDSRFLESAVFANITPSHSWGLDWGATGAYSPGELVVGGYNPSRASMSSAHNYTVFADKGTPCPLQIRINKVSLTGKNGNTALNTKPFSACLEPAVWAMVLPIEVQDKFVSTLSSTHPSMKILNGTTGMTWEYFVFNQTTSDFARDEEMIFELDDGLEVTVPNNEIFGRSRSFLPTGGWNFTANSQQAALGTAGFSRPEEPIVQLGGPFLSQIYLGVDYEFQKFFITPIIRPPTANGPNLRQLGCGDSFSINTASFDGAAEKKSTPVGAIVGGVVGGLAAIAILIIVLIFFRRKRAAKAEPVVNTEAGLYKAQYDGQYAANGEEIPKGEQKGPGASEAMVHEVYSPHLTAYPTPVFPQRSDQIAPVEVPSTAMVVEMPGSPVPAQDHNGHEGRRF